MEMAGCIIYLIEGGFVLYLCSVDGYVPMSIYLVGNYLEGTVLSKQLVLEKKLRLMTPLKTPNCCFWK